MPLIENARKQKSDAFYVSTQGFDDIISRLALRQLDGDLLIQSRQVLNSTNISASSHPNPFAVPQNSATSLIKSNAYPLTIPTHATKFTITIPPGENRRHWLDDRLTPDKGALVSMDDGILAFADTNDLIDAFGPALHGNSVSIALTDGDVSKDGRIRSLLRRALVQSIAKILDAKTDGSRVVWQTEPYETRTIQSFIFRVHAAISFKLESILGQPHVALMPEVVGTTPDGILIDPSIQKLLRNEVYGFQHNHVFDQNLKYWTEKITNISAVSKGGGIFKIGKAPIYAGLFQKAGKSLPPKLIQVVKQKGVVVQDANLVFSSPDSKFEIQDPNPLRGLVQNRPWDFGLTTSGLATSVEIAAICPIPHSAHFSQFLNSLQEQSEPGSRERDYLHTFPGFSKAFGLPLTCPKRGEHGWVDLDELILGDGLSHAKELAHRICKALDMVRNRRPGAVVTIFVPTRWAPYEKIDTVSEYFDLHHHVKSYAARHGQSTQFIREVTTRPLQLCRVKWWLSLAFYAKSSRTPWRLDCLDDQTAFVGIGYSIDANAMTGRHVLLGCSHLYNARGEGLQFRLGRIESPIMRGKNAFMSLDDARRTGETIRQLFFESKMRLPSRVVIHKRTPFTSTEQMGLLQGLDGVSNVELIEITIEESLRYLASKIVNSQASIDTFPLPRGAVVVLNQTSMLLWVHGVTQSAENPRFRYYQGKRRIPAPLLIRRYRGQSDMTQVATEILGLSKMNWNSFDYYSRLPATLDSANAIARLGPYLSGFASAPYDYRYLI